MISCPVCLAENEDSAKTCVQCGRNLPLARGTLIAARYEIDRVIGSGGMGVVYKAHDRALDESVALKVLRSDLAEKPELTRRFLSEIKLARRVGHRNVCRVFEYGEDGRLRYIAMELVEGVTLRQVVRRRGKLSADEAFDVAVQIASGLEAIHELGVVHRDLKSANIMRDTRGVYKLMDFGIAKELGLESVESTATGVIIGSPEYMSPEQAKGAKVNASSDVYSLGIVIYEIFTGEVPFSAETPVAAIMKHINEPPPLDRAKDLPAALVPVLRRALAKNAHERYATAGEMLPVLSEARAAHRSGAPLPPSLGGESSLETRAPTETIEITRRDGATFRAPATVRRDETQTTATPSAGATLKPPDTVQVTIALGRKHLLAGAVVLIGILIGVGVVIGVGIALRPLLHSQPPVTSSSPTSVAAIAAKPSPIFFVPTPGQTPQAKSTPIAIAQSVVAEQRGYSRFPTPRDQIPEVQIAALDRLASNDPEEALTQATSLARRYPANPVLIERARFYKQRVVAHRIDGGQRELEAAAAGASDAYERAASLFEQALELDPSNADARAGRAAAVRGQEQRRASVAFVQGETVFTPPAISGPPPGMGALPPGVTVRPAAPPAPKAQIVIEIDPQQLRPGDAYVVRYQVYNQSSNPLSLMAASVLNRAGASTSTGGQVAIKTKVALPRTRTMLLETRDTWNYDPSTQWSTTFTLMLNDGSVYSSTLAARR